MRRIKKKMLLMCTVALICAGVFTFNSCATTTGVSTGLLLTWLAVDSATLLAVWFGEGKVSSENAKDQTNGLIDGIANFFDAVGNTYEWVLNVVTP